MTQDAHTEDPRTGPDRVHPEDPAEGSEQPGADGDTGRTPHPQMPAEGSESAGGADTPTR